MNKKKLFFALSTLGIFTMCGVFAISFKTPLMAKVTADSYTIVFDKDSSEIEGTKIKTHTGLGNVVAAEASNLNSAISPTALTILPFWETMEIKVQQLVSMSVVYDGPGYLDLDINDEGRNEDQYITQIISGQTYTAEHESFFAVTICNSSDDDVEITSITITYACA